MERPFFSIIIACYNSEQFIGEAIESILRQTIQDWELIIVDDFSSDRSFTEASKYTVDSRISVCRLDSNHGPGFARNYGVCLSKGRWVAVLDSDDIYLSNKLEQQKRFIDDCSSKNIVLVGTGMLLFSSSDEFNEKKYIYPAGSAEMKNHLRRYGIFPPHSSIVYNAKTFNKVGGFDVRYQRSEDYDLWLRLSNIGEFASIPEPLIKIRKHRNNISTNLTSSGYMPKEFSLVARVCDLYRLHGLDDPSLTGGKFDTLLKSVSAAYRDSIFLKSQQLLYSAKSKVAEKNLIGLVLLFLCSPAQSFVLIASRSGFYSFEKKLFESLEFRSKV